jgi:hypothetical protein
MIAGVVVVNSKVFVRLASDTQTHLQQLKQLILVQCLQVCRSFSFMDSIIIMIADDVF